MNQRLILAISQNKKLVNMSPEVAHASDARHQWRTARIHPLSWVARFEIDAAWTKGIVPKDEFMPSNEKCVSKGELLTRPSLGPARRNSLPQGKTLDTLCPKKLRKNESLSQYLGRFNATTLEIDNLDESVKYTAFMRGLRPTSKFVFAVNKSPPGNMSALLDKANKYIQAEEYLETLKEHRGDNGQEQEKELKRIVQEILHEIKDKQILEKPDKMRSAPSKRDKNLWCRYHNDHGHTTDNCESLKHAIKALIKCGHLRGYINRRNKKREAAPLAEREEVQENAGVINTIYEGIAAGGSSGQGRKAYAREVFTTVGPSTKKQKIEPTPTISFSDDDVGDTRIPHEDPLVVTLRVGNFDMKRILVDNGSSAEVLFYEAFQKMNIPPDRLRKIDTPLYDFSNHPVVCEGIIALPVTVGAPPTQAKLMLDFVVIHAAKDFEWTEECQKSFEELKLYLSSLPLLTKPVTGEDLFLYLSISEVAVSTVLIREEEGKQRLVYYISKVLEDVETRYPQNIQSGPHPCHLSEKAETILPITHRCPARFVLVDGVLYKKSFSLPYLKCLSPKEADYALQEVHEGICGQHLGGRNLAHKILRQGYYWPGMQKDAIKFAKKYDRCQKFAPLTHTPAVPLSILTSPIPFAMWGMDILGPFPMATGQRRFVIVAIDYFTKWTEAEALATITASKCEEFFWKNVVCRFGVPKILITDNGKQFDNSNFRSFCEGLSIGLRFTSVAHPQSNGQTENMNRSILQGLKRKLDDAKGAWVDELPKVLWAYRTTPHSVTGETPFLLCFGTEALLPLEVGLPTVRVLQFAEAENEENLRGNLDLLDDVRAQALDRMISTKRRVARYYNRRVRMKIFRVGDLVLRKLEVFDPKAAVGKLSPNWEGPYKVSKVLRPGAYSLETLFGEAIPRTWNAENLRQYYQ
ncbi:hypothetical protein RJ639_024902 [Escallonia herrerae]|uniref:Integrase catalytic domain-containing protein n=1 Tax=Escallonia herrerae TaxID=1293975 RepID=A0AA89AD02_9ASTE|nr:hypothetical protein RJ639_024902 [Escallonia herrerae]